MKIFTKIQTYLLMAGAVALGLTVLADEAAKKPKTHGTDIFHLSLQKRMVNGGVLAGASGRVDVHLDTQGKGNHQDVHLQLTGLDASASYQLAALLDDDTNLTQVVSFTPDDEGHADIHLRDKGPKHPDNKNGHVNAQLPPELQPITLIHQLLVSDTNGATVLSADLTAPDRFQYLVKRDLSTGDIRAKMQIKSDNHKGQVRLDARGLQTGSQYSLALNGNVAGSETADHEGKINLRADLQNAADIFALS